MELLDEDPPPQGSDGRRCRQDLASAGIQGDRHVVVGRPGVGAARQRRLHLLEPGEIRLLEHETDVRVGDQLAPAVDDVGAPGSPDPDLGNDVPDELEIDLGDRHPGLAPTGDRKAEIRLGFLPEVHRPEVGPPRPRLIEPRVVREIGLAAHHVHREPGHSELLPAGRVELADLGHRGRLALETDELEAPLLDRRPGAHLPLARPPDLALDVPDEGLDARRGAGRLLTLERHQGGEVLVMGEIELDEAAGEQGGAHQAREEHHVLPEQAASRPDGCRHPPSGRVSRASATGIAAILALARPAW